MSATPWWHNAVTYEIYVRSFADSNGDGVGDLPGIRSRLPYLASLGIDAIWLTPFYPSPMADHGYDVADYFDIDPLFGTLDDFDALLTDAHALGLRVVTDVVPNHTSSRHAWFAEALADPSSPMRERYHFHDPKPDGSPPNNWTSVFGGPAWTLDPHSGQYYLHLFASEQPDLNWNNPAVHDEWERILRFWLDRGVDGFRIDVAHGLYKHPELLDTPEKGSTVVAGTEYQSSIVSSHLWDRPEVHNVYRRWRRIVDSYDGDRAMVGEVFLFDANAIARYGRPDELHLAFNFTLMGSACTARDWKHVIDLVLQTHGDAGVAACTWVLSSHDVTRHVTRYDSLARTRGATLTMLALPGHAYLYQGEELGLPESDVPADRRTDPIFFRTEGQRLGRDGCRTPIPWTGDAPGFGFTTSNNTWLPFGATAATVNVAAQKGDDSSTLGFYRRALHARRSLPPAPLVWRDTPKDVLAFTRANFGVAFNPSKRPASLTIPEGAALLVASDPKVTITDSTLQLPADAAAWFAS